jgi:hypothetical protein
MAINSSALVPGTSLNLDLGEGIRRYRGIARDERGRPVWMCGHYHRNRDLDTLTSGWSAFTCAKQHLKDGGHGKGPDDWMRS